MKKSIYFLLCICFAGLLMSGCTVSSGMWLYKPSLSDEKEEIGKFSQEITSNSNLIKIKLYKKASFSAGRYNIHAYIYKDNKFLKRLTIPDERYDIRDMEVTDDDTYFILLSEQSFAGNGKKDLFALNMNNFDTIVVPDVNDVELFAFFSKYIVLKRSNSVDYQYFDVVKKEYVSYLNENDQKLANDKMAAKIRASKKKQVDNELIMKQTYDYLHGNIQRFYNDPYEGISFDKQFNMLWIIPNGIIVHSYNEANNVCSQYNKLGFTHWRTINLQDDLDQRLKNISRVENFATSMRFYWGDNAILAKDNRTRDLSTNVICLHELNSNQFTKYFNEYNQFIEVARINSVTEYNLFIKNYPNHIYLNTVKRLKSELVEKNEYTKACSINTLKSYKAFLDKYPNGKYASQVKSKKDDVDPVVIAKRKREAEEQHRRSAAERQRQIDYENRPIDFVTIDVEMICHLCMAENLEISGGPGQYNKSFNGASMGAIHKGYNGQLAGTYSWSAKLGYGNDKQYCSGTFYLSGKKRSAHIKVYDECRSPSIYEY